MFLSRMEFGHWSIHSGDVLSFELGSYPSKGVARIGHWPTGPSSHTVAFPGRGLSHARQQLVRHVQELRAEAFGAVCCSAWVGPTVSAADWGKEHDIWHQAGACCAPRQIWQSAGLFDQ